jgi:hypothetical protein
MSIYALCMVGLCPLTGSLEAWAGEFQAHADYARLYPASTQDLRVRILEQIPTLILNRYKRRYIGSVRGSSSKSPIPTIFFGLVKKCRCLRFRQHARFRPIDKLVPAGLNGNPDLSASS